MDWLFLTRYLVEDGVTLCAGCRCYPDDCQCDAEHCLECGENWVDCECVMLEPLRDEDL